MCWKYNPSIFITLLIAIFAMSETSFGESLGGIIRECPPEGDRCRFELSGRTNAINAIGEFHGSLTLMSLGKVALGEERFDGIQVSLEMPENKLSVYRLLIRQSVDEISGKGELELAHIQIERQDSGFHNVDLKEHDQEAVLWFLLDPKKCILDLEPKGIDFEGRKLKCLGIAGCDDSASDDAGKNGHNEYARRTREIWLCSDVPFGAVEMTFRIDVVNQGDRTKSASSVPLIRVNARLVEYEQGGSLHKIGGAGIKKTDPR